MTPGPVMPLTGMATAVRTTSASDADGPAWRNQCRTAARSAAATTPASSSGLRSLSAAPIRRAITAAQCPLAGRLSLQVLAVQRRFGGGEGAELVQPVLRQPFLAAGSVETGHDLDESIGE